MTKARDLANIISGGFTVDDLPTLTASEIPNLDAAKITSGTFAANNDFIMNAVAAHASIKFTAPSIPEGSTVTITALKA